MFGMWRFIHQLVESLHFFCYLCTMQAKVQTRQFVLKGGTWLVEMECIALI